VTNTDATGKTAVTSMGLRSNMRMQLTRPRERWPAAERWTSASLQLIRGRWADVAGCIRALENP
jgi:hypothetical protein